MKGALNCMVYVGNLSHGTNERDLEDTFSKYGKILKVEVKGDFGFLEFDTPKEADDAIYYANGKDLHGKQLRVEQAKGPRRERRPPGGSRYRILVDKLSYSVTWQQLKDYFRKAGEVVFADVIKDSSGKSKGYGIVEYKTYDDMKRAVRKLHDTDFMGSYIYVKEDIPRDSYSSSRRRYSPYRGGRSRRRSRSYHGRSYSRSRSPSPRFSRKKYRSRSRSYSPNNGGGGASGSSGYGRHSPKKSYSNASPKRKRSPSSSPQKKSYPKSSDADVQSPKVSSPRSPTRKSSPLPNDEAHSPKPTGSPAGSPEYKGSKEESPSR